MRGLRITLIAIVIGYGVTVSAFAMPQVWTPTVEDVSKLEARLNKANLPKPFEEARRRYGGRYDKGRREIVGQYDWDGHPGIEIVQDGDGLRVMDGGCSIYNIWYDAEAERIIQAMCGGR